MAEADEKKRSSTHAAPPTLNPSGDGLVFFPTGGFTTSKENNPFRLTMKIGETTAKQFSVSPSARGSAGQT